MTSSLSGIRATLCALVFALLTAPGALAASAGQDYVPTGTLVADKTLELPIAPTRTVVLDRFVYVIGGDADTTAVMQLDATSLEIIETFELDFVPGDVALSHNGEQVYVIGGNDDGTVLQVLTKGLEPLGRSVSKELLKYPSITVSNGDILIAVGMGAYEAKGLMIPYDVANQQEPTIIDYLIPADYGIYGATHAWLDNREERTVFLNVALLPALVAFGVGEKGIIEYSDLSFEDGSYETEPLTTHAIMPERLCRGDEDQQASFIVSSSVNHTLFLAEFDADFKSLEVLSRTQSTLKLPLSENNETYNGSEVRRPTALLDSSCDQGVVWISNKRAQHIEQFAVNPNAMQLELVGGIELEYAPTDIAVSTAGRDGFVISAELRTISRFSTGDGSEVVGTEMGRNLQRLLTERGYQVGAIDGQIGVKTMAAVQRFEERNKVKLDIRGDLEGAIEAIQRIPVK
ncbi:MAG: peptidoglycan-binding domain-containing protein [Pseudomonadota bacterium]